MNNIKRDFKSFDILLFLLVVGISVFGIVAVSSALRNAEMGRIFLTVNSQVLFLITGVVLLLVAAFVDYRFVCNFFIVFYILNILLLVLVLIVDRETGGVSRWIKIYGDIGIQPSEFSKIFMLIFLAKLIDKYKEHVSNPLFVLIIGALTLFPIYLIQLQPSLSASLVTGFMLVVMLFTAKIKYRYFVILILIIIPIAIFFYYDLNSENHILVDKFMKDYQIRRIVDMLAGQPDPEGSYQINQSVFAIGSGQLYGRGLYQNTVYVPFAYNDFIFANIGAEFGFLGSIAVLAVMLLIIIKCLLIGNASELLYGKLICAGAAGMLAFQTFVNVGVAAQLLPVTGMTFPFVSMGGSAMWVCMAAVGLVINVGMTKTKSIFDVV